MSQCVSPPGETCFRRSTPATSRRGPREARSGSSRRSAIPARKRARRRAANESGNGCDCERALVRRVDRTGLTRLSRCPPRDGHHPHQPMAARCPSWPTMAGRRQASRKTAPTRGGETSGRQERPKPAPKKRCEGQAGSTGPGPRTLMPRSDAASRSSEPLRRDIPNTDVLRVSPFGKTHRHETGIAKKRLSSA